MALPPIHRVDHTPVYVLSVDSAWDADRIQYELDVVKQKREPEPGRDPVPCERVGDHPIIRYHNGASRCDLETVRQYLREEEAPVRFVLRRLSLVEWTSCGGMVNALARGIWALQRSLVRIEGAEIKLARGGGTDSSPLDAGDIARLRELCGDDEFEALCAMSISISQELLDHEKKP
jgi:hypothetical protein